MEKKVVDDDMNEKTGWDYLDEIIKKVYDYEPIENYGTLISYKFGGPDPLPQISVYETKEYYHYITYGFSNIGEIKLNEDGSKPEYSGYGLELTLRVKKDQVKDFKWIAEMLQDYARYVFETGNYFSVNEFIGNDPDSIEGINPEMDSTITAFITTYDDKFGIVETPNGKIEFLQLVGITQPEFKKIVEKEISAKEMNLKLREADQSSMIDLYRQSIV